VDGFSESVGEVGRDARHDQPGSASRTSSGCGRRGGSGTSPAPNRCRAARSACCPTAARNGTARALILHRGEHAYVIFNAYPYNPGHLMVVPYAHVADLEDLDGECAAEVWELARRTVRVLKERVHAQGVNLGMNLGAAGGAGIAEHLHLHAVPRWVGDTNFITVVGAARVLPRALEEMWDELAPGFAGDEADAVSGRRGRST
jgi:ATP adenylyltransferase